jgi:hypothetical protein
LTGCSSASAAGISRPRRVLVAGFDARARRLPLAVRRSGGTRAMHPPTELSARGSSPRRVVDLKNFFELDFFEEQIGHQPPQPRIFELELGNLILGRRIELAWAVRSRQRSLRSKRHLAPAMQGHDADAERSRNVALQLSPASPDHPLARAWRPPSSALLSWPSIFPWATVPILAYHNTMHRNPYKYQRFKLCGSPFSPACGWRCRFEGRGEPLRS